MTLEQFGSEVPHESAYQPEVITVAGLVAERLSPEIAEALQRLAAQTVVDAFGMRLLQVQDGGGDVEAYLQQVRDFCNALNARMGSERLDPAQGDVAILGATALMIPEVSEAYAPAAMNMVAALQHRYSLPVAVSSEPAPVVPQKKLFARPDWMAFFLRRQAKKQGQVGQRITEKRVGF